MAQCLDRLDPVFHALDDPTRRAVLVRLGHGPASVSELAAPFDLTLPSFMKHLQVLERGGWVRTRKSGRVRTCTLDRAPFAAVDGWLAEQRAVWEGRTDRLEHLVTTEDTDTDTDTDTNTKEDPS